MSSKRLRCTSCGSAALELDDEVGSYVCRVCNTVSQEYARTFEDDNVLMNTKYSAGGTTKRKRKMQQMMGTDSVNYFIVYQRILQLQSDALIQQFGVNPMQKEILRKLWLRYVETVKAEHDADGKPRFFKKMKQSANNTDVEFLFANTTEVFGIPGAAAPTSAPAMPERSRDRTGLPDAIAPIKSGHPDMFRANVTTDLLIFEVYGLIHFRCSLALQLLACTFAGDPILPCELLNWAFRGHIPYLSIGHKYKAFELCDPNFEETMLPSQFFLEHIQYRFLDRIQMLSDYPQPSKQLLLHRIVHRLGLPDDVIGWCLTVLDVIDNRMRFELRYRNDRRCSDTTLLSSVVLLVLKLSYKMDHTPLEDSELRSTEESQEAIKESTRVLPSYDELVERLAKAASGVECFESARPDDDTEVDLRHFEEFLATKKTLITGRSTAVYPRGEQLSVLFKQLSNAAVEGNGRRGKRKSRRRLVTTERKYATINKEGLEGSSKYVVYSKNFDCINVSFHPRMRELMELFGKAIGVRPWEINTGLRMVEKAFLKAMGVEFGDTWASNRRTYTT